MRRLRHLAALVVTLATVSAGCDESAGPAELASTPSEPVTVTEANGDIRILDVASRATRAVVATPKWEDWPSWSPDGRLLAFSRLQSGNRFHGDADLFTVDVASGVERPLLVRPEADLSPSWAPDAQNVVFMSLRQQPGGEPPDLWSMDVVTGATEPLIVAPEQDFAPTISPDGATLAFLRFDGAHQGVWTMDLGSRSDPSPLTPATHEVTWMAWSPDGRSLAYTGGAFGELPQLWVLPLGTGAQPRAIPGLVSPAVLTWSPDGHSLAVEDQADGHLYLVDVETGAVIQLTCGVTDDTHPRWSPDGSQIAYVALPNPPGSAGTPERVAADC